MQATAVSKPVPLQPGRYYHIYNRGNNRENLFLEQRNYQQALDNFDAALHGNLRPSWIEAWARIKRGNAYDGMGDRARAVHEYEQAVDSGIDFDGAQRAAKEYLKTPYDPKATTQQAASGVSE